MSIPASEYVAVNPSVLLAGGAGLALNGVMLTQNHAVPVGTAQSFPGATSVGSFFGLSSPEYQYASIYFQGRNNATLLPALLWFASYQPTAAAAYLRGGALTGVSLTTLQALSGVLTVSVDGESYTSATINLATASSYSNAAVLIQDGFGDTELDGTWGYDSQRNAFFLRSNTTGVGAAFTGVIAPGTASVTGSIAPASGGADYGGVLTVTAIGSGTLYPGAELSGSSVTAGTQVLSQLTGTTGGIGTYAVSVSETVASEAITASYGQLTVSNVTQGTVQVGQIVSGTSVTADTQITAEISGTGGAGTYVVSLSQTVASELMTCAGSSVSYATGTLSTGLSLTQTTGAVQSVGTAGQTPTQCMAAVVGQTQNWAAFMCVSEPVTATKVLFSQWVGTQNNRFMYVQADADATITSENPSSNCWMQQVNALTLNGSAGIVADPTQANNQNHAAFILGMTASLDTNRLNGRINYAYKSLSGLAATVSDPESAANAVANGYNYYGAVASASANWNFLYPGIISGGQYGTIQRYVNQIWLNSNLQLALVNLLTTVNSISYNTDGNALVYAACGDPISAALNFGAIRTGVQLSQAQIAEVNNAAGAVIDTVLSSAGWYLQILPASPQARQVGASPPITLWYMDGGDVNQITMASILVE